MFSFFSPFRIAFADDTARRLRRRRPAVLTLGVEPLEDRQLLSVLAGVGAVGDSYTVEYQFIPGRDAARNWLEQLAEHRPINFGAFSTSPWDATRGPGYEYNWAVGSGASYDAQVAGLAGQVASGKVTLAAVMGGLTPETNPGDPNTIFSYLSGIYSGSLTGVPLSAVLNANVAQRTNALDTLSAAGHGVGGVDLVMADYANFAATPQGRQLFTDPAGRQRLVDADTLLNAQLETAANARGVPVLDVFGFSQFIDQLTSSGTPLVIGGYPMDMTDYTPSSQELTGTPVVAKDFWADEQHFGSVAQGLLANMFISAADNAYGAGIAPFSDQEILTNAGITPPPSSSPTYFDVSRFVIYPTPTLSGLSVNAVPEGNPNQALTINGSNFLTSSVIEWNGTPLPTTFVNTTTLQTTIPAADLAEEGTASITVANPTPGGGPAGAQSFTVNPAPPTANVSGPSTGIVGQQLHFTLSAQSPSPVDRAAGFSYMVHWGDGTPQSVLPSGSGSVNLTHSYATPGSYQMQVTATDDGGFTSAVATQAVNVYYQFSGFAAPLGEGEAFHAGRTLPLKFQLSDSSGHPISNLASHLVLQALAVDAAGNTLPGATPQPLEAAGHSSLRWDDDAKQYVFKWKTKGLTPGYYKILIALDDGTLAVAPAQQPTIQLSAKLL